jgi:hypothetical protein
MGRRMRSFLGLVAAAALVGACSGNSPNGEGAASGAGGKAAAGSGGAPAAAGANSAAGANTAGVNALSGASTGGNSGNPGSAGQGGSALQGGSGGTAGSAGQGGTAGVAGSAGAGGGATSFTCNQITAMTLTREWFEAGFEADAGIVNARWQLKAREHGYITEWSNPASDFWNQAPESPCAAGSTNPDHVVLTVLSWNPACCTTQPQWEQQVEAAVTTLVAKYSALKRIDLMTVIRGPGNALCPTPPVANETIAMPPELDAALAAVAAKHTGLVFVAPKFEAPNCAAFSGGGPHLTTAGNTAVAKDIAAHFDDFQ